MKEREDLDPLPVDDDQFTPAAPQGDRPPHRRHLEVSAAALTASAAFLIAGALFYGFGNETTTRGSNQIFAPGQSVALSLRYATVNLGWGEGLFLLGSALLVGLDRHWLPHDGPALSRFGRRLLVVNTVLGAIVVVGAATHLIDLIVVGPAAPEHVRNLVSSWRLFGILDEVAVLIPPVAATWLAALMLTS